MPTTESLIEILRAHLARAGLTLCCTDDGRRLTGAAETMALRDVAELVLDSSPAPEVTRLVPRTTTGRMSDRVLDHARALSRSL